MTDETEPHLPAHLAVQIEHARAEGHKAAEGKLPPPSRPQSRWKSWAFIAAGLFVVAAVILLGLVATNAQNAAQDAKDQAQESNRVVGALANQVRGLGGTPVATAGAQGPQGAVGPGPSDGQVADAVASYCAVRSGCIGTPSPTDVAVAVRSYCADGRCKGATGASGASGTSGSPGQPGKSGASGQAGTDGKDGTSPSTADVAAAVAAYCDTRGGCTGPAGPKGDTGATGPSGSAGRGISSIDCTGLGVDRLRITYDDGTTQDVPCDLDAPTDTSTPSASETP